nr:MAG TPA: NinG protein [Caudoviricetes sp.]
MAKEFAKAFYNSKAWLSCRKAYISKRTMIDGGMCETCKENPGYIVHHKIPLTPENIKNPLVALNQDNLKFDCKDCHDREEAHAFVKRGLLRCSFDADGQPVVEPTPPIEGKRG